MVLGLIGGAGSGKSFVLSCLKEEYDAVILETDAIGKTLQMPGEKGYFAMISLFGSDILLADGTLNRSLIAERMFQNSELRLKVNQAIHPLVYQAVWERIHAECPKRLIVIECAILKESGLDKLCDRILYVYANEEVRMERLKKNRGYSREKCLLIIKNQATEEENRRLSDAVLDNSLDEETTKNELRRLINMLFQRILPSDAKGF